MGYYEMITKECERIDHALKYKFPDSKLISADLSNIIYGLNDNAIVFVYDPNQYEYGKVMFLKGIMIRMQCDTKRQYGIRSVLYFLTNREINVDYSFLSLDENIKLLKSFLEELNIKKNENWEKEYSEALKAKYNFPW